MSVTSPCKREDCNFPCCLSFFGECSFPPQPPPIKHTADLVKEFHKKFYHPIAEAPNVDDDANNKLRLALILEEAGELAEALGWNVMMHVDTDRSKTDIVLTRALKHPDIVAAADAVADLDYVVSGAGVALGFPMAELAKEVHRSNMSKLGKDGLPIHREDGKIIKGPDYSPPDIEKVLYEQQRKRNPSIDAENQK